MQLVPPVDHILEGISLLVSQYRNKPKLAVWIMVYLQRLQEVEDSIHAVVDAWSVDNAVGWRLDVIGDRVGQPRTGSSDDVYRLWIKARIRANRSGGRIGDLRGIADLLIPGYQYRTENQNVYFYPPSGSLTTETATAVQEILQKACSQGGRVWVLWTPTTNLQPMIRVSLQSCVASGLTDYSTAPGGHEATDPTSYEAGHYVATRP